MIMVNIHLLNWLTVYISTLFVPAKVLEEVLFEPYFHLEAHLLEDAV